MLNLYKLYVFGENQLQKNKNIIGGGQAEIRGLFNAFGFCTLEGIGKPWSDEKFPMNSTQIEMDIAALRTLSKEYEVVVFPKYGLGTGRAAMQSHCPRTFLHMCMRLLDEFGYNNIEYLTSKNF